MREEAVRLCAEDAAATVRDAKLGWDVRHLLLAIEVGPLHMLRWPANFLAASPDLPTGCGLRQFRENPRTC